MANARPWPAAATVLSAHLLFFFPLWLLFFPFAALTHPSIVDITKAHHQLLHQRLLHSPLLARFRALLLEAVAAELVVALLAEVWSV